MRNRTFSLQVGNKLLESRADRARRSVRRRMCCALVVRALRKRKEDWPHLTRFTTPVRNEGPVGANPFGACNASGPNAMISSRDARRRYLCDQAGLVRIESLG
jgi:hypothetical protein